MYLKFAAFCHCRAQVVGWPPIRSFRKNSLATTSKNNEEVDGKPSPGALFVKVSMDGAPYLRKVDLRTYTTYQELSAALEKMFSCFTIGEHFLLFKSRSDLFFFLNREGNTNGNFMFLVLINRCI